MKTEEKDMNYMLNALDNEKNHRILNKSQHTIKDEKNEILQKVGINGKYLSILHKKLQSYAYISNIHDLNEGSFIRWINLKKAFDYTSRYEHQNTLKMENVFKLTSGCTICSIETNKKNPMYGLIRLKNKHMFISIYFQDCIIFQKFTMQEELLMYVMKYLSS